MKKLNSSIQIIHEEIWTKQLFESEAASLDIEQNELVLKIPYISSKTASDLFKYFNSLDQFHKAAEENLWKIRDLGIIKTCSILDWLAKNKSSSVN